MKFKKFILKNIIIFVIPIALGCEKNKELQKIQAPIEQKKPHTELYADIFDYDKYSQLSREKKKIDGIKEDYTAKQDIYSIIKYNIDFLYSNSPIFKNFIDELWNEAKGKFSDFVLQKKLVEQLLLEKAKLIDMNSVILEISKNLDAKISSMDTDRHKKWQFTNLRWHKYDLTKETLILEYYENSKDNENTMPESDIKLSAGDYENILNSIKSEWIDIKVENSLKLQMEYGDRTKTPGEIVSELRHFYSKLLPDDQQIAHFGLVAFVAKTDQAEKSVEKIAIIDKFKKILHTIKSDQLINPNTIKVRDASK